MSLNNSVLEAKQSFGLYDLFGYIFPGFFFFAIFIIDYDGSKILHYFDTHQTLNGIENASYNFKLKYLLQFIYYDESNGFGLITFIIFIVFCYLIGHVMASFSSFMAKHTIKRFLRNPSDNLFEIPPVRMYAEKSKKGSLINKSIYTVKHILHLFYQKINLFCGDFLKLKYRRSFEAEFRVKFKECINRTFKFDVSVSDYYWLVSAYITAHNRECIPYVKHFVNLSGFARNIAGTFTFYILFRILLWKVFNSPINTTYVLTILGGYGFLILIMLWTYLRLFKRQAVEMFYIFYSLQLKNLGVSNISESTNENEVALSPAS